MRMSKKDSGGLVTKESICATGGLFAIAALFILCTRSLVFGEFGASIHAFLTGALGYCAYPLLAGIVYVCVTGLLGKRLVKDRALAACIVLVLAIVALIVHTATTFNWSLDGYIHRCFEAGEKLSTVTVAGWLGGAIVYGVAKIATQLGALIFFILLSLVGIYVCVRVGKREKKVKVKEKANKQDKQSAGQQPIPSVEIPLSQPAPAQSAVSQQPSAQQAQPAQANAYPYANAVQQAETAVAAPVPTATQSAQAPYSGNFEPTVSQRPGVSLSETQPTQERREQPVAPTSFSPFGDAQKVPISENPMPRPAFEQREGNDERKEYNLSNPREFLFGGSPADNYKRNLLFDPNARVNNMPVSEQPNGLGGTSGFMPSYSEAYQNSVNDATSSNRTLNAFENRPTENTYGDFRSERIELNDRSNTTVTPMPTFETDTRSTQDSSYTLFGGASASERESLVEPKKDTFDREASLPTGRESEDGGYRRHDYMDLFSPSNPNVFGRDDRGEMDRFETSDRASDRVESSFQRADFSAPVSDRTEMDTDSRNERDGFHLLDDENPYALRSEFDNRTNESDFALDRELSREDSREARTDDLPRMGFGRDETISGETFISDRETVVPSVTPVTETPIAAIKAVEPPKPIEQPKPIPQPPKPRVIRPYVRVRLDDLDCRDIEPTSNFEEVEETKQTIISTLEDFKVSGASIASVTFGPTVARYNVTIPRNISPKKVVALDQSIAISLRSNGVNVYPNYEDGVVSIGVPNKERQFVQLGCMLSGDTFVNAKSSSLMFTMGKDVANRKIYGDISKMIHLLVAGSSGSGKSVFLGALIISLIYKYSPEELRLILIDPKKTEFVLYNDLPHLMINEIITDANKAVQSLNWAIMEMNRRYGLFEQMSRSGAYVVNLDQYNAQMEKSKRLPKIVIIIDELADLMLAAKKEMEDRIQNLTQKARAAGIHLIVATQRPSTDVITGVIKSNLPTRVAFYVATDVDSRVILDQTGAQKLLGKGDFLYTMPGVAAPIRVQSAFISTEESQKVVNFIKNNNEAYYDEEATAYINSRGGYAGGDESSSGGRDNENVDPMYIEALRHVIACGSASISMIQRKCSAGYSRAGKIVEWMEDMGYISAFDGAKARKVLITKEEFESKYGPLE